MERSTEAAAHGPLVGSRDGWLSEIFLKNIRGDSGPRGGQLRELVGSKVETAPDVTDFKPIKALLQVSDGGEVRSHLRICALIFLGDLIDDELGITLGEETANA